MEVARRPRLVARRDRLHRRVLQGVFKLTFARGAALDDPTRLFNASLEGGTRRAIDLRDGVHIDEAAFKTLIRTAVAANTAALAERAARKKPARPAKS